MRKAIKPIIRIIVTTIVVVGVTLFANKKLLELGNQISSQILINLVERESKGLYELSFEQLELNTVKRTVRIYNAKLKPKLEQLNDSSEVSNIYAVTVDSVIIDLKTVLQIYIDKRLIINAVSVVNPNIQMTKINPERRVVKFGRETGELYDIISQYLKVLSIENFSIRSGAIRHSPSKLALNQINFEINNFLVTRNTQRRQVFYSESISLGMNNQAIYLPDSIHAVTFDEFRLSTKDSVLTFNNLKISPKKGVNVQQLNRNLDQNIYDITIPAIDLKGINYHRAYTDNFLVINEVSILSPILNISTASSDSKIEKERDNSLLKFLTEVFDELNVKYFRIENAVVDLLVNDKNTQTFRTPAANIELFHIRLDSANYEINSRSRYFEDVRIAVNEYTYKLPDSLHQLSFKKFTLSTLDSTLFFDELKLAPFRQPSDSSGAIFHFSIPTLDIVGVNFIDAFVNKTITARGIEIKSPDIYIKPLRRDMEASDTVFTPRVMQDYINALFYVIKAKDVSIDNGKFRLDNRFSLLNYDVFLSNILIDSMVNSWHHLADSVFVNAANLRLAVNDHQLRVKKVISSDNLHNITLEQVGYSKHREIELDGGVIKLIGFNLDSLISMSRLYIDSLLIDDFDLSASLFAERNTDNTSAWQNIQYLSLDNAHLRFDIDSTHYLQINQLSTQLNPNDEQIIESLILHDARYVEKQLGLLINLDSLYYTRESDVLSLHKMSSKMVSDQDSVLFDGYMSHLLLKGWDQSGFFSAQKLIADSLSVYLDDIDLSLMLKNQVSGIKRPQLDSLDFEIHLKHILFQNTLSNLQFRKADSSLLRFKANNWTLTLNDFQFPRQALISDTSLLFAAQIAFDFLDLYSFPASGDTIAFNGLAFDGDKKSFTINNFNYHKQDSTLAMKMDKLRLVNWSFASLLDHNELIVDSIYTGDGTFYFSSNLDDTPEGESLQSPFSRINIESLVAEKNDFVFQNKARDYRINKLDVQVEGLNFDSLIKFNELPDQIRNLSFSGLDYEEDIGAHFKVIADYYQYCMLDNRLEIAGIRLKSHYDRFSFSSYIDYQSDWFDLDLDRITLDQIDTKALVNGQLRAKHLKLHNADFVVFRDLNIPIDSTKYVPLLQEALGRVNHKFIIDTISVNANIKISILPKDGESVGYISFDELNGSIYGLGAPFSSLSEPVRLKTSGKINQRGDFEAQVYFPLNSDPAQYYFEGKVYPMDLASLNDMLVPLAAVEVRSGITEGISFSFEGNNDFSEGDMNLRYKNLRVNILNPETYESGGGGAAFRTFFANTFIFKKRNPSFFKLRKGRVFYERDKNRSIFNFWAKSLLSGAISSIGISKTEDDEKAFRKKYKFFKKEDQQEAIGE